jgi:hypothetical protein
MDKTLTIAPDQERLERLAKCELAIEDGKRRGREAIRSIAKALNRINDEKLYEDKGYKTFNQYVESALKMDRHSAMHIIAASHTILTLENAGIEITAIPAIEKQLVLLHKIPSDELPRAWSEGVAFLEKQGLPLNSANIKRIVDFAVSRAAREEGVNPELDMDDEGDGDGDGAKARTAVKGSKTRTEEAELALERIGRMAGEEVRSAIEEGIHPITDRDLIKWASETDQMVKNLAYYIVDERWSLGKAIAYEAALVTEHSTIESLARLATARGGRYESEIYANNATFLFQIEMKE